MKLSFVAMCALVTVGTVATSILLAPILWDAVGTIEATINSAYNVPVVVERDCDPSKVYHPLIRAMEC